MRITLLRGRPEERFKFAIGLVVGAVVALPANVLVVTNRQYAPEVGYVVLGVLLGALVLRKRTFVVGVGGSVLLVSLPQAIASVLPTPLTVWHVSASLLWLTALAILGCLYLMREAETRTDADIDAFWLFRPQE